MNILLSHHSASWPLLPLPPKTPSLNNIARPHYPLPFLGCCHLLTFKSCSFISWKLYLTFTLSYNSIISLRYNCNNDTDVLPPVLASLFLDLISSRDILLQANLITHCHSHILHLIVTNNCNFHLISVPGMPLSDHHHLLSFQVWYSIPTTLWGHRALPSLDLTPFHHLPKQHPAVASLPYLPSLESAIRHYNFSLTCTFSSLFLSCFMVLFLRNSSLSETHLFSSPSLHLSR